MVWISNGLSFFITRRGGFVRPLGYSMPGVWWSTTGRYYFDGINFVPPLLQIRKFCFMFLGGV